MTIFNDMLYQFGGAPVSGGNYAGWWGSTVWFVDGANGNNAYSGKKPTLAFSTISKAITEASAGDTIYIKQLAPKADATDPNAYTENLTIPYAKHSLSIIGTGNNRLNPFYCQVKPNAAGHGVEINAPSTLLENIDFNKGSATTGVIYLNGDSSSAHMAWGTAIANSHIRNASSTSNPGVFFSGGSYSTIYNVDFDGCDSGVYAGGFATFPLRSPRIENCRFKGKNNAAVTGPNIEMAGVYEGEITGCIFERKPTNEFIDMHDSGNTGIISNCYFGDDDITPSDGGGDISVNSSVLVSGCYDNSGALIAT